MFSFQPAGNVEPENMCTGMNRSVDQGCPEGEYACKVAGCLNAALPRNIQSLRH